MPHHTYRSLLYVMRVELDVKLQLVGRSPRALICASRETSVPNVCTGVVISCSERGTGNTKVTLICMSIQNFNLGIFCTVS